jgi:hypothetical protein
MFLTAYAMKCPVFWNVTLCSRVTFREPHSLIAQKAELFHFSSSILAAFSSAPMWPLNTAYEDEACYAVPSVVTTTMHTVRCHTEQAAQRPGSGS